MSISPALNLKLALYFENCAKMLEDAVREGVIIPNNDMLTLYGFYKQGTVGDCNTSQPGMLDFKGKSKWKQWNSLKGMDQNVAKAMYVQTAINIDLFSL
uniref:ACB domain-containing protein n=1 Tax=viral metagenome TaxID=1070528 RepID=A0A6C0KXR9_9ZZZZ